MNMLVSTTILRLFRRDTKHFFVALTMDHRIILLEILLASVCIGILLLKLVLRKPLLALLLPIIFFVAKPQLYLPYVDKLRPALLSILLLLVVLGLHMLLKRRSILYHDHISWFLVGFIILCSISTFLFGENWFYKDSFILKDFTYILIVYFATLTLVCDELQLDVLLKTLIACGALLAISGAIEYFLPGVLGNRVRPHVFEGQIINRIGVHGIGPNGIAATLMMIAPLSYYYLARAHSKAATVTYGCILLLLFAGTVLTFSRAGFLCLALAVSFMVMKKSRWRTVLIILTVVATVMILAPPYYWFRMESILSDSTGSGRTDIWRAGFRMFQDNVWHGVGYGNFPHEVEHFTSQPQLAVAVSHNVFIQLLAETGIFITIFYLLFIIRLFFELRSIHKDAKAKRLTDIRMLTRAIGIALIIYLVLGIFGNTLHFELFYIYVGVIVVLKRFVRFRHQG